MDTDEFAQKLDATPARAATDPRGTPPSLLSATARKEVDWENVERHYRAGLLSIRQLGKQFGVSAPAILKKAKKEGWTRDLTTKVREAVNTQLVNAEVNAEDAETKKRTEREIVQQAAATIVQIVREHRKDIAKGRAAVERMLGLLETEAELKLPAQAQTLRDLTTSLKTLVMLEREAFSVVEKDPGEKAPTAGTPLEVFEARIAKLTGAMVHATDD
jgi:hypothetical protein